MKYILSLSILLLSNVSGFIPNIKSNFFPFKNGDLKINYLENDNLNVGIQNIHDNINEIKNVEHVHPQKFSLMTSKLNLLDHDCPLLEKIKHTEFFLSLSSKLDEQQRVIGKKVVIEISSLLPHFDGIGHQVLHANNEFISHILSLQDISDDLKKDIILLSIKFAQYGDNFGSFLLQLYYDIVNYSL